MNATTQDFDKQLTLTLDRKTKPVGSLRCMETLAAQLARIQASLTPNAETCTLLIFASDNGMASAGDIADGFSNDTGFGKLVFLSSVNGTPP